ncbi:glutathione S-transferase T1 isoform X5 [Lathyrus oleraceus]|uniref:glutathione transferase n=1 Tax=Pisum sativum TaxID=3888 RepID=A0A9D4VI42_PEA|nr:glutathione S-transferase T1-like isoform X5 [Pisum sativum]KAI5383733.1 Glutathione S-transferase T1, variant 3 [Pisum sativum]
MQIVCPNHLEQFLHSADVNPLRKVPAIVHGNFNLSERYPTDVFRRAKIQSVLDWHHSNLRYGADHYVINTVLGPALGHPLNPKAASEAEKVLSSSLSNLEKIWLNGNGRFLLGGSQPSIADLSLVCELVQLEVLDEKDRDRILSPYKKVVRWIEDTRAATNPHFDQVHNILFRVKMKLQHPRSMDAEAGTETSSKMGRHSKM